MLRAHARRLHRARLGAMRSLLPELRRHLVQPATRGARMGAIGARQAITRLSTRRRARLRPKQPARPTPAVRRSRPPQAAATFTKAMVGSSSTPTRSAPASAARSCCAPVRPISHCRPRHRGVLLGTHGVLSGTHRGYSRRAAAVLPCGPSRTAVLGTIGYYGVHTGVHTGYHGAPMGYYGVLMGYTWGYTRIAPHTSIAHHTSIPHLGARWRRSTWHLGWERKASLPRLGSCCEGMRGVRWVLIEYSRRAPLLRACSIAPGRARSWICGRCRKSHVDERALVRRP
jgi:hypothetical protein